MNPTSKGYHDFTSYDRNGMTPHLLDWANQPVQIKSYPGIHPLDLSPDKPFPDQPASAVLCARSRQSGAADVLDFSLLSGILAMTSMPTALLPHSGGGQALRSTPSAGALYPTEIYASCKDILDIEDGLYHFEPIEGTLRQIRKGDPTGRLKAIVDPPESGLPRLTIFLTAIVFRSAWKYRDRSYRYHLLDTGHVLESLLLALDAFGVSGKVSMDFRDEQAHPFLGIDGAREFALAVVQIPGRKGPLGSARIDDPMDTPILPKEILDASRVSTGEKAYPSVLSIHEAGYKPSAQEGRLECPMMEHLGPTPNVWTDFMPPHSRPGGPAYVETVLNRRSRRNFIRQPMGEDDLSSLLESLFEGAPCREEGPGIIPVVAVGVIAERVDGMNPGYYLVDLATRKMALVREGSFTRKLAGSSLDQAWLANAAVHVLFMSNLDVLDRSWGGRGYRYAMTAAGRLGQRVYLASTARGLGCCGIGAFYDQEMVEHLMLNPGSRLLYLVATGPVRGGIRG